ncbi:hypothetical protein, partial [Sphingobacterium siyangense]|uniref:hypothetical protein n=1 Tax=Sphingobacterium siyangense TaxID=459529 RepID=UPI0028ADD697
LIYFILPLTACNGARFFLVSDHSPVPKVAKRVLSEDLQRISVPTSHAGFHSGHRKEGALRKRVLRIGREWQRST